MKSVNYWKGLNQTPNSKWFHKMNLKLRVGCWAGMLVSWGCCKKLPPAEWLTMGIYSVTVLEPKILNSRCHQGHAPLKSLGRNPLPPPSFWWLSNPCHSWLGCNTSFCAYMVTWSPSLCFLVSLYSNLPHLSFMKTPVVGFRAHPNPVLPHLNLITFAKILVPNKLMFTGTCG